MATSDYSLTEDNPQTFYDFTPEEYNLDYTPPGPEPVLNQNVSAINDVSSWYGYTPSVYSGGSSQSTTPSSGSSGQWWEDQGVGDWGKSDRESGGSTGFSSGMTMPQSYISSRGPAPTVPTLSAYEMPERGEAPVFNAPEWDESKINRLSQEHAAAPIRTLREAYQRTAARLPSNPQSRLLLKDALAGYGSGLESAISGAKRTARAEYGQEHGREFQAESMKYSGAQREFEADYQARLQDAQQQTSIDNQNKMMQYQSDYNEYMNGGSSGSGGSSVRISATNLMEQHRDEWLQKVADHKS